MCAVEGVLAGDLPAFATRRDRGHAAVLHPDRRRIRDPRSPRRLGQPDDRPDPMDGIFSQQGLACCFSRVRRPAVRADRADLDLSATANPRSGGSRLMLRKASSFNLGAIVLGLGFLYLPILILVIYSFNASRLVTVWGGWSTRWYGELINDSAVLASALVSVRVAV